MGCPFNFLVSPPDVNSALLSGGAVGTEGPLSPPGTALLPAAPVCGWALLHWHILLQLQRKIRDKYISYLECSAIQHFTPLLKTNKYLLSVFCVILNF